MLSGKVQVLMGIRQEDPSALLFNIAIEPLILKLKAAGIKVQCHCDDTAFNISTKLELATALRILTAFEKASGMLLNRGKSVILALKKSHLAVASGFLPKLKGNRYLGILFTSNGTINILPEKLESIIAMAARLAKAPLSLFGR